MHVYFTGKNDMSDSTHSDITLNHNTIVIEWQDELLERLEKFLRPTYKCSLNDNLSDSFIPTTPLTTESSFASTISPNLNQITSKSFKINAMIQNDKPSETRFF